MSDEVLDAEAVEVEVPEAGPQPDAAPARCPRAARAPTSRRGEGKPQRGDRRRRRGGCRGGDGRRRESGPVGRPAAEPRAAAAAERVASSRRSFLIDVHVLGR